ncbi:predicted protein [Streptomyces albidoflavus]|nr:predicted protein [Streptomyces albidoflavus]
MRRLGVRVHRSPRERLAATLEAGGEDRVIFRCEELVTVVEFW